MSKFKLGTYPTVFSNISFQHCWHIFKIYNDQTLHRVLIVVFLGKLFKFMQVIHIFKKGFSFEIGISQGPLETKEHLELVPE